MTVYKYNLAMPNDEFFNDKELDDYRKFCLDKMEEIVKRKYPNADYILNNYTQILDEDYKQMKDDSEFYSKTLGYLGDLIQWNRSDMYWEHILKKPLWDIRKPHIKTVVDFGGGVGTLSLLLHKMGKDVIYVDVPSHTMDLAKETFKELGVNIKVLTLEEFMALKIRADVIMGFDVLEHIENFIPIIEKWVKVAPMLIFNAHWSKDGGKQPMHYEYTINLTFLMLAYGYIRITPYIFTQCTPEEFLQTLRAISNVSPDKLNEV